MKMFTSCYKHHVYLQDAFDMVANILDMDLENFFFLIFVHLAQILVQKYICFI